MKVVNLRVGHATNSSSSHSIVLMRPGVNLKEDYSGDPATGDGQFGWDNFVLTSEAAKRLYLLADTSPIDYGDDSVWRYVDHDSAGLATSVPLDVLLHPRVAVIGGNDNGNKFLPDGVVPIVGDRNGYHTLGYKSRLRRDGDAIVMYDPRSGFKIRIADETYTKASAPELVDVKITDYCPFGCAYCYQGSTTAGAHATLESIVELAEELQRLGVFEVAIGGGEPTMHPNFAEVLRAFYDRGITPNFTTYTPAWTSNPDIVAAVNRCVGGIGVSVENAKQVDKALKIREAVRGPSVLPQVVVWSATELASIVSAMDAERVYTLLLLGYKSVGRGATWPGRGKPTSGEVMLARIMGVDLDTEDE